MRKRIVLTAIIGVIIVVGGYFYWSHFTLSGLLSNHNFTKDDILFTNQIELNEDESEHIFLLESNDDMAILKAFKRKFGRWEFGHKFAIKDNPTGKDLPFVVGGLYSSEFINGRIYRENHVYVAFYTDQTAEEILLEQPDDFEIDIQTFDSDEETLMLVHALKTKSGGFGSDEVLQYLAIDY